MLGNLRSLDLTNQSLSDTASSQQGCASISASGPAVHGRTGFYTDFSALAAGLEIKSKSALCTQSFACPLSVRSLITSLLTLGRKQNESIKIMVSCAVQNELMLEGKTWSVALDLQGV